MCRLQPADNSALIRIRKGGGGRNQIEISAPLLVPDFAADRHVPNKKKKNQKFRKKVSSRLRIWLIPSEACLVFFWWATEAEQSAELPRGAHFPGANFPSRRWGWVGGNTALNDYAHVPLIPQARDLIGFVFGGKLRLYSSLFQSG
jgi:hypothetical protein